MCFFDLAGHIVQAIALSQHIQTDIQCLLGHTLKELGKLFFKICLFFECDELCRYDWLVSEFVGIVFVVCKSDDHASISWSVVLALDRFIHEISDLWKIAIRFNEMLVNLEEVLSGVHDKTSQGFFISLFCTSCLISRDHQWLEGCFIDIDKEIANFEVFHLIVLANIFNFLQKSLYLLHDSNGELFPIAT